MESVEKKPARQAIASRLRAMRVPTCVAALSLIVTVLSGLLAIDASAGRADVGSSEVGNSRTAVVAQARPPYPPYPPTDCLRHYQRPTRHGWKIELVWWGGRYCPRIFYRPAKAEIWMYEGFAAPQAGPWSAAGGPTAPTALYGGHQQPDSGSPAPADDQRRADAPKPAATWWEKVEVVPVNRNGYWSAEVFVDEPGPYTFAAVNSISREYVLIEVEIWDDMAGSDGGAGGAEAAPVAVATTAADPGPGDDLLRMGVPTASSALVMGAALLLLRRVRRRRQQT